MSTYKEAGVDIEAGDQCSKIAYQAAKNTFSARAGMIGQPLSDDGGFAGALDMGDFYLIQNDDGVGTKIEIAERMNKYDTLGYDLIAMVADDAICMGAETISVTNTLDVDKVDPDKITQLMSGLQKAAQEQKIVIPGGEIAELGSMVNGYLWNATAVGILEKTKMINPSDIEVGDKIIGLHSAGLRSNGFTLVRHILKKEFGNKWHQAKFNSTKTWGEATLTPSKIYSNAILEMHGRYKQKPQTKLKAIAHITGGGIPGNLPRIFKKTSLGAKIDHLPETPELFKKLMQLGNVAPEEAYKTWNMGIAMIVIAKDHQAVQETCSRHNIQTSIIGEIVKESGLQLEI